MQVKLDQPLSFIKQADLTEFVIYHRNGSNVIVAGSFSQMVKKSELDQIMAHNILKAQAPVVQEKPKTSKQLMAEAKALKEKEDADAKAQADANAQDNKPDEKL